MAVIDCPSCRKKISDKSKQCPECHFSFDGASKEDLLRKKNFNHYKKIQGIQSQSMIAMLMFVGGIAYIYYYGASDLEYNIAALVGISGFVWYIVNRVRLVMAKRFER